MAPQPKRLNLLQERPRVNVNGPGFAILDGAGIRRGDECRDGLIARKKAEGEMSKETDRANLERLVREAMEKKTVAVKKGDTRMEAKCGKCGAPNRVKVAPGTSRTTFKCKECGHQQSTL